ncbi:hypothetical protein GCM10027168_74130 [Streptomyces capparidis]
MAGRAGAISDWSMANTPAPVARTAKVTRGDVRGMGGPLRAERIDGGRRRGRGRPGARPSERWARRRATGGTGPDW